MEDEFINRLDFVYRCMVIPDEDAGMARNMWATLNPEYSNEFRIPLARLTDPTVITHWLSAGLITGIAAPLMPYSVWDKDENGVWVKTNFDPGQPSVVAQMCRDASPALDITDSEAELMWARSDVTDQPVQTMLDRLALTYLVTPEPEL